MQATRIAAAAAALIALAKPCLMSQDTRPAIPAAAPAAPATLDEVTLFDGSRIYGEIVGMEKGVLTIKNVFSAAEDDLIKVEWSELKDIKMGAGHKATFLLKGGSRFDATAVGATEGNLTVRNDDLNQPATFPLANIDAINPAPPKIFTTSGNLNFALSIADGNTNTKTVSLFGELESRIEKVNRITLRGAYNYASDDGGVTARNGKASIKYDYFLTDRFYIFASALFEHDSFQDLALRTALSIGPGYQFIDKGDFDSEMFKEMQLYAEAGIAYFSEDHKNGPDDEFVAGRWAVKFDWPIVPKKVVLFHYHEGYPGLERAEDLYITTEQGVRFTIWKGFIAAFQVNWRWDNTPTPGFNRSDTLYLFSLGFAFDETTFRG